MIVAKSKNNVIGKDNKLIWDIPEDLRYFKEKTTGKTVVMGRKTHESIGRPLPNRRNIVLTRSKESNELLGVDVLNSVSDVLDTAKTEDVVIIGGSNVYEQFLEFCDIIYITEVDHYFEGDSFFPELGESFVEVSSSEHTSKGKDNLKYFLKTFKKY